MRQAGTANPARMAALVRAAAARLELNLSGLCVLTEAASGPFVVTPVIAAAAGADRVLALTRDSSFASADAVIQQARALELLCGLPETIEIHQQRTPELFAAADIITNLGFVRPIDSQAIAVMKPTAVAPLMCESWEYRPGDVDLEACARKGIPVMGTDEDHPKVRVFDNSGWLAIKMLLEAEIEVFKSQVLVVGTDKFRPVIAKQLTQAGSRAIEADTLINLAPETLAELDAILVADYTRRDTIIGQVGDISPARLSELAPHVTVIEFAGVIDVAGLKTQGIHVYPGIGLQPRRMAFTLAELGPRPVIDLHAAGLRVGQALAEARLKLSLDLEQTVQYALDASPAQVL